MTDTLQPNSVSFQAFDTLIEKLSGAWLIPNSVNIDFLEVDGHILVFKERFDSSCGLLTDAIARNQSHLIPA